MGAVSSLRADTGADQMPDLEALSDVELAAIIAAGQAEQRRRALEAGDTDAIIEAAFSSGFATKGTPVDPWVVGPLVVCPGSLVGAGSKATHTCSFAHLGGDGGSWVWECEDLVVDKIRHLGEGSRAQQRSVSLVAAVEGLELDVIASRYTPTGGHQMRSVRSFVVRAGALELVSTRATRPEGAR